MGPSSACNVCSTGNASNLRPQGYFSSTLVLDVFNRLSHTLLSTMINLGPGPLTESQSSQLPMECPWATRHKLELAC